jgi:isopentenyl diphosphate isomerase/L-lactate dehydrogenase-like FMN-dependent dehydrogenase
VRPGGEVAVARAAAAHGTAMGLSSFSSKSIEEVATANPKTFFQVYWAKGQDWVPVSGAMTEAPVAAFTLADRRRSL